MTLKKVITTLGLFALLFLVGCNKTQPTQPTQPAAQQPVQTAQIPPDTTQVNGAALYAENCASCHGASGEGGAGGSAINTDEFKNNSAKVQNVIKKGKDSMPSYSGKLNDNQITAIGDFVASLKK